MTLQELIDKLKSLDIDNDMKANVKIYFFAEDDYNTFDVEIKGVEVEDGKIYLS